MTEYSIKQPLKLRSIHPGEILREDVLPALGLSVSEMARRPGVSRSQIHRTLACTYLVTAEMALRVGKLVGKGPRLRLSLQQNYDQWRAQQGSSGELKKIKPTDTSSTDLSHH